MEQMNWEGSSKLESQKFPEMGRACMKSDYITSSSTGHKGQSLLKSETQWQKNIQTVIVSIAMSRTHYSVTKKKYSQSHTLQPYMQNDKVTQT